MCETWTRLEDGTLLRGIHGIFQARMQNKSQARDAHTKQTVVAEFALRPSQKVLISGGTRLQRIRPVKF